MTEVLVREAAEDDAEELIAFLRRLIAGPDGNSPLDPDEAVRLRDERARDPALRAQRLRGRGPAAPGRAAGRRLRRRPIMARFVDGRGEAT